MGITIKENQSIGFNSDDTCKCGGNYCQPILTTDKLSLQGFVTPQNSVNLVADGDFGASTNWTLGAGWTISGGKLNATNISGTTADSVMALLLTAGKNYLIRSKITVTNVGSATSGNGFIIKVNNQMLSLPQLTANNASLTGTWLFKCGAVTTDAVQFSTNESTIDFNVDYFEIYELSEVGLAIYNGSTLADNITSFTGSNYLHYIIDNGVLTTGSILYEGDYAYNAEIVSFNLYIDDWSTVTSYTGCATLRIYDTLSSANRIRNGGFLLNLNYWTAGAHWAYSAGKACYTGDGVSTGSLYQNIYLEGENSYTLSFDVSGLSGGEALDLILILPTSSTTTPCVNGTNTVTINLNAFIGLQTITVRFIDHNNSTLTCCVDNVSCIQSAPDALNSSDCIKLSDSFDCSILFTATNSDNAFGFDYVTEDFTHYLRLEAKLELIGFPEEKEEYRFSDNSRVLLYAESEEQYELRITDAPDYIHACLRMMRLNDTFTIDGIDYVVDGSYELRNRKTSKLKQAVFTVKKAQGISSNYSCS